MFLLPAKAVLDRPCVVPVVLGKLVGGEELCKGAVEIIPAAMKYQSLQISPS